MTQSEERESKGTATRQRIIVEARRTLVADGYDAVVLRTVADRLDMKLGNLQYYFRTRDDLLLEVIRCEAQSDLDVITSIAERVGPAEELLRQLILASAARWRSDSGVIFSTLLFLSPHRPAFGTAYREVYAAFYEAVETAIRRACPGHHRSEYQRRARLLTALIDGAAMQTDLGSRTKFMDSLIDVACAIAKGTLGVSRHDAVEAGGP